MSPSLRLSSVLGACVLTLSLQALGQTRWPIVTLDAARQAALGVRTTAILPATAQSLLATATVTVPPGQEMTVSVPMAGLVSRLDVGLGDPVRAGTTLAWLSSPALADARRQLREAELEARQADAALQRDQAMFDEGIIAAARLQNTRSRQQAAQAHWEAQRSALHATGLDLAPDYASARILAPRAGTVVDVQASVGQRLEAGALLMRIADLRQLQLDIVLSGEKASQLKVGDRVMIPEQEAQARVHAISHSLDASQQARARARVTVPGRLQVGQSVQVQLQTALPQGPGAWQVPARALMQIRGQNLLLVARENGFAPTAVQVVSANDDVAVVQGPLQANQRVASAGLAALRALLQSE